MFHHSSSQLGKRDKNEDELDIIMNLQEQNSEYKKLNFYAVYDGHGGSYISKFLKNNLSKFIINKCIDESPQDKTFDKYIFKIYDYIQNKLIQSEKFAKVSGSTALIAIHYLKHGKQKLKICNLGDCRAVLCSSINIAIPLTKDHKPMNYEENKRIIKAGGNIIQDINDDPRINNLSVSRAFGDLDATPHVIHIPEIFNYELSDHKFLIMACDGVWDVLDNQSAIDFVLYTLDKITVNSNLSTNRKDNIAFLLARYCIDKGSMDNISVMIIFF